MPSDLDDISDPACGAGWFRNGDNCYRYNRNSASWSLARQTCQSTDPTADLLWVTSKQEEVFIQSELLVVEISYFLFIAIVFDWL